MFLLNLDILVKIMEKKIMVLVCTSDVNISRPTWYNATDFGAPKFKI